MLYRCCCSCCFVYYHDRIAKIRSTTPSVCEIHGIFCISHPNQTHNNKWTCAKQTCQYIIAEYYILSKALLFSYRRQTERKNQLASISPHAHTTTIYRLNRTPHWCNEYWTTCVNVVKRLIISIKPLANRFNKFFFWCCDCVVCVAQAVNWSHRRCTYQIYIYMWKFIHDHFNRTHRFIDSVDSALLYAPFTLCIAHFRSVQRNCRRKNIAHITTLCK